MEAAPAKFARFWSKRAGFSSGLGECDFSFFLKISRKVAKKYLIVTFYTCQVKRVSQKNVEP